MSNKWDIPAATFSAEESSSSSNNSNDWDPTLLSSVDKSSAGNYQCLSRIKRLLLI